VSENHHPKSVLQCEPETLSILYRDDYFLAVHKPAGLLVHKSPIDKHETRYAMNIIRDQIGQWVYPVHRLDKPTSGLLLFALSSQNAKLLNTLFTNQDIHKTYAALVRGFIMGDRQVDHPMKEIAAFKNKQYAADKKEAQIAITNIKPLTFFELPLPDGRFSTSRYTLLEMKPCTGRKHQLRRHAKHISHPIIGDVKYGKGEHNRLFREQFGCSRLLLAANKVEFVHPITEEKIMIHCPLEANFSQLLDELDPYARAISY
jgi:tRNA pseudouridine65 synthase